MLGRRAGLALAIGTAGLVLTGCAGTVPENLVTFGDTDAVREANELAITCRTDEALALAAQTANGRTLAGGIAELQRVVFLRDAGRVTEADRALEARNRRVNADAQARALTEQSVAQSLADLRAEREERSGRATCG